MPIIADSSPDFTPSIQDVADELYTRTKTAGGRYVGNFTDETIPTGIQVTRHIAKAVTDVIEVLGRPGFTQEEIDEGLPGRAKHAAALRAAMIVERSHFTEQIATDKSPYTELKEEYTSSIKTIVEAMGSFGATAADSSGTESWNKPVFGFDTCDLPITMRRPM
jgi:hypothetical protein